MDKPGAPAGPCEWCGGPQWWTIVSGEMYVKCQNGCVSLFPSEVYDFPPTSEDGGTGLEVSEKGTNGKGGVVTLEGDAAKETDNKLDELPF